MAVMEGGVSACVYKPYAPVDEFEHGWETIDFKAQGQLTKWLTFICFRRLGYSVRLRLPWHISFLCYVGQI